MFGGNSNWRGPVWFPVNYLLIEALQRYHHFYGDDFQVECPTGSGQRMSLNDVAADLSSRLMRIFLPDTEGLRPALAQVPCFANDPHWHDLMWFFECFDGDTGRGVGANHQTGWTALVARILEDSRRAKTCEEALETRPSWRAEKEKRQPARPKQARTTAKRETKPQAKKPQGKQKGRRKQPARAGR